MSSDHGLNNYRSSCDWPLVLTLDITSTCLRRCLVVWLGCFNSQHISGDIYERTFLIFIMNQVWCNSCTNVLRCVREGIVPQERYRLSPQILTSIDSILQWRLIKHLMESLNKMQCRFCTEHVVTNAHFRKQAYLRCYQTNGWHRNDSIAPQVTAWIQDRHHQSIQRRKLISCIFGHSHQSIAFILERMLLR